MLRQHGFDVLLYTFDARRASERAPVDPSVLRRRVDGILIVGFPLSAAEVEGLVRLGKPIVCLGWGGYGPVTVRLDDRGTAINATRHLLGLGHTRIAHITGAPDDVAPWSPPVERAAGWRAAMEDAGLAADLRLEGHGHFDLPGGRASTRTLLERVPDVTGIFAASDEMAMGAILALRDAGRRVPEDVSVIGVDGHDLGELVRLTTMVPPAVEEGAKAATLLLDLIAGGAVPGDVVYQTTLLDRGSTGPPRAAHGM
jgi:DNA-binding LacI/PurR family transcriptional regulator